MDLSEQAWRDAQNRLNERIHLVTGENAAFRIHYWGASPGLHSNQPHKHSFFEACYCTQGEGVYQEEGKCRSIRSGTMFCSRPDVPHRITVPQEGKLYLLYVAFQLDDDRCPRETAEAFERLAAAEHTLWLEQADHTATAYLWKALLKEAAEGAALIADTLGTIAYGMLCTMPQLFAGELFIQRSVPGTTAPNQLVEQAKLFIRDNLSEPLRIPHLADYLHVSVRHLSRLFNAEQGESIGEFLRKERLKLGAELLASGELSIKEIAERTGMGSIHYFTRVFSKEMGMTPAVYRRRGER